MTYEEIQKEYPIGTILRTHTECVQKLLPYYNSNDISLYKEEYDITRIMDDNFIKCEKFIYHKDTVEGWVYDGKEWYPAYQDFDGWQIYEDIEEEEEVE